MTENISLHLSSSQMKFAAAHFTIFSATERENLHGHNFTVSAHIQSPLREDGLMFDYQIYKTELSNYCKAIDEKLLLPLHCPYLKIENTATQILVHFADEVLTFLPRDVVLLPIANISVENLASYFLTKLLSNKNLFVSHHPSSLSITVASSPSQSGEAHWKKTLI